MHVQIFGDLLHSHHLALPSEQRPITISSHHRPPKPASGAKVSSVGAGKEHPLVLVFRAGVHCRKKSRTRAGSLVAPRITLPNALCSIIDGMSHR
jgi:hypothetical protein